MDIIHKFLAEKKSERCPLAGIFPKAATFLPKKIQKMEGSSAHAPGELCSPCRPKVPFSRSLPPGCKEAEYLLITKSFPHFPQTFPQPFSTGEFQL
ncbi:MAG: hypothetical protein ACI3XG_03500, partial [Faecousia sp.]